MSVKPVAYFISDIHLGSAEEPKSFLLLKFFDQLIAERPSHLFLLGDIFDLWIGRHKYFIKKYSPVIDKLLQLQAAGTEIHYFEGNHDLYLDAYFGQELSFKVHAGPISIDLLGQKIRLEHGDQMDPEDHGYIFLRWFLRTALIKFVARHLPDSWVVAIGEKASEVSRDYTSKREFARDEVIREKILKHAQLIIQTEPYDVLLAGHVHVKEDRIFTAGTGSSCRVLNLGTWLQEPVALKLSAGGVWQWQSL